MLFEFLNLVLGVLFGFLHRGKEDYAGLVRNGVIAGFVLGLIFILAAQYAVPGGLSIDFGSLGLPGFFAEIILFLVIFILGVFIGDRIEALRKR